MAAIAFPYYAKSVTLSTANTYSYAYIQAMPTQSTILFLHGFPSSCYDWRHQIAFFAERGYGVLAPDLLGYGGTSKPAAAEAYNTKRMAKEIAEILDHEQLSLVHAVSHDTGSILLSRLANYYPDILSSITFLAVPYSKPAEHFDLEAVNAMSKAILGKEKFGYIDFFIQGHAGKTIDQHSESFFTLFYPADANLWADNVGPTGAMESWLREDTRGEKASYITDEERDIHEKIMRGHHTPALNWYHMLVENLNEKDELDAALSVKLTSPVLMIFPASLPVQPSMVSSQTNEIADDLTVKKVSTTGHWLQLEAKQEVNFLLSQFFERCDGKTVE